MTTPLGNLSLRTVDTPDEANELLRWLGERRPGPLGIDTETTGLEWWTPNFLRLVQFGDAETGWTVSARRWWGVIDLALRRLAEDHTPTVFHNAKFDMHALTAGGLPLPDVRRINDTKVMSHLVKNDANHGLKALAEEVWGPAASAGQALLRQGMQKHRWTWATVPEDFPPYGAYAAIDAVLTARLAERFAKVFTVPSYPAAYEREMSVQNLMWQAEQRGMLIDAPYAELLRDQWVAEARTLRDELGVLGIENPSAKGSVEQALRDDGWNPEEWTATGEPKLDKVVLAELAKRTGLTGEVAVRVLRYKRLVKWVSAYLDRILASRDAAGRWHPSVNTLGARTGRMSAELVQTFPRGPEVRRAIAADPGSSLWSIDYDSQELRIFAAYAGEPGLIQAIAEGLDMHRYAAAAAYGIPYEEVPRDVRQVAKNVQYSRIFGAGPAKMAQTAGVPEHEIQRFLDAYDRAFPQIDPFMQAVETGGLRRMHEEGRAYVTTWGGRRVAVEPDRAYALVNYLVQGSAADLLKDKLIALDAAGLGEHLVIPVHDEVVLQLPDGPEGEEGARLAASILEDREAFAPVPLTVEVAGPGASWGDVKG